MKRLLMLAAVVVPATTYAVFGGWAVTTVENVPEFAVTGKPFDLTYTVRQHGHTPLTNLKGMITVSAGDISRSFDVTEIGEGMYKSQVTLPASGKWTVRIHAGFGERSGTTLTIPSRGSLDASPLPMLPYDRGRQLFVVKGCATCHSHQLTKDFNLVQVGPDLSEPKFAAAYLTRFLANPAIKTDWRNDNRMPNLGLKPDEISALVAFLNK